MSEPPPHRTIQPSRQPPLLSPRERQSTTALREARLHSPWKRSACDRCRSLKLKCKRDNENTTQSCIRCTRADATCFTSSAKAPARLAQAQTNAQFASPAPSPVRVNTDITELLSRRESRSPIRVMQINSDSAKNQDSTFLMRWPFSSQDEHAVTLDINFDVDMPSPSDESGQANYFESPADANEPPFHLDPLSSANPSSTITASTLPLNLHGELFSGADGVLSLHTPSCATQADTPVPVIEDEVNPGVLLADLQQSLSKQLAALESKYWDLTTLSITSSATGTSGNEQEIAQEGNFNPVASILASTSEFVTILRLLKKPATNVRQNYRQNHEGSQPYIGWPTPVTSILSQTTFPSTPILESAPTLTITSSSQKVQSRVHLLTTINCYFLVLSIFDGIFSRLLATEGEARPQGSTGSRASSSSPLFSLQNSSSRKPRPELLFAGHSVTLNARLRTRLLVQVVEHQLEILEHDLGLPQQYCVSSTRADDTDNKPAEDGILGRRDSLLLLQAVMGWTADTDDSGSFHRGEELGRSPVTSSLIDKLKRAQRAPTRH
ncbi:hypothetical protein GGR51DRAFT_537779 [Nemania sp. FL0031]|nr:hypothetical protein GGR51DRAFT_537779 [Nemania sp. FL0031]